MFSKFIPLIPFYCIFCSVDAFTQIPEEIKSQYCNLQVILKHADDAYFKKSESVMSDEAYDYLRTHHDRLLSQYPELRPSEVPIFPEDKRSRIQHKTPVLSLKKTYSDIELTKFCQKHANQTEWLIEPKIDGTSVVVEYKNGKLHKALSRGNSLSGIDVTKTIITSKALPLNIHNSPEKLYIRGEFFITLKNFQTLNNQRIKTNKPTFTHPRNLSSGSLLTKNYSLLSRRKLQFLIFECTNAQELGFKTDVESLTYLKKLGLPIIPFEITTSTKETIKRVNRLNTKKDTLDYPIDGWVIKCNNLYLRNTLGTTQKYPRWAIARKFRSTPTTTVVEKIIYSISNNGKKTPVAILSPIEINGATIKRANLHSDIFMESLNIHEGSKVQVIRAGGVIPEIVGVIED